MTDRIEVRLSFKQQAVEVGTIVQQGSKIYFRHKDSFLTRGLRLSPFQLQQTRDIQAPNTNIFSGLFGVFADALPDGWGRLLLDRMLASKGINLDKISPLDRLAMVGDTGMGALTFHPVSTLSDQINRSINLDKIAAEAKQILNGAVSDQLEDLVQMGGSSGGARPKIVVGYHPDTNEIIPSEAVLPPGYEHWLIKFSAGIDPPYAARIEMAYHKMAVAAGLDMMDCKLFPSSSGKVFFGTKRFDRVGNDRLHLHSAAGLLHDNFRLTNLDYGHVMDAAFRLEQKVSAYEKILRLATFNVFAHNRDDHSKNISFLMDKTGRWKVAPAYDLTFSQSAHGHHSMTVFDESLRPGVDQLMGLAKNFSVRRPERIIEEVRDAISQWSIFAQATGVPDGSIKGINQIVNPLT